ncbi:MAG: hypothetical protein AAB131_16470 [Actinomycetota bacterium]
MADDEFRSLKGAPISGLSAEFRARMWDDIDDELRRSAGPTDVADSPHETRRVRTWWVAAAAVLALGGGVAVTLVRSDGHHRIASTPESVPRSVDSELSTNSSSPVTTLVTSSSQAPRSTATITPADGPLPAIAGNWIELTRMTSETSAWVVTNLVVAHTRDAGNHWVQQPLIAMADGLGAGASFILDDERAWIARSDGGEVVVARTQNGAVSVETTKIKTGFARAAPLAVVFVDAMNGFLSVDDGLQSLESTGRAPLYRTSDGGKSFRLADPNAPIPLAFADQSIGWGRANGLFLTTDGAATWRRVTPPGWDISTVTPSGPGYSVITTSPERTLIKLYAPTGMEAQVRYLATEDLGSTWNDVAPPDTSEVSGTGPQSMLTAVSASRWFGLQQGFADDATLWTTTNAGRTYLATGLPFAALDLSMATPVAGLATTYSDLRITQDAGLTWRKIADVIAPVRLPDGCVWQPNYDGHDGASQRSEIVIRLTNIGQTRCHTSTVVGLTGSIGDGIDIAAGVGGFFPVSPASATVDPGQSIVVVITVVNPLEDCGSPPSRPILLVTIQLVDGQKVNVPLEFPVETACAFDFLVGAGQ